MFCFTISSDDIDIYFIVEIVIKYGKIVNIISYEEMSKLIEQLYWVGYVGAGAALIFAFLQARKVFSYQEGSETMIKIASAIRAGANAFMKRQYTTVAIFLSVMFVILAALAYIPLLLGYDSGYINPFTPFAFITGGTLTALCGFIGMKVSTYANSRTAFAASESLNKALRVAFSSGSVMGFIVNGLAILELRSWKSH